MSKADDSLLGHLRDKFPEVFAKWDEFEVTVIAVRRKDEEPKVTVRLNNQVGDCVAVFQISGDDEITHDV